MTIPIKPLHKAARQRADHTIIVEYHVFLTVM